MVDQAVHSANRSDWETPPELIADLKTVFPFDLDVCASRPNVCDRFYSPEQDGLAQIWRGLCWGNFPYGRKQHLDRWMRQAMTGLKFPDLTVVCLPPARTGTRWWHETVPHADLVVFIRGRLRFRLPGGEAAGSAPFPSAFVVFGDLTMAQHRKLASYGWPISRKVGR